MLSRAHPGSVNIEGILEGDEAKSKQTMYTSINVIRTDKYVAR